MLPSPEGGSPYSVSGSEASSTHEEVDDSSMMPPIDNSELCVQESSSSKKLPSLTNEGMYDRPVVHVV